MSTELDQHLQISGEVKVVPEEAVAVSDETVSGQSSKTSDCGPKRKRNGGDEMEWERETPSKMRKTNDGETMEMELLAQPDEEFVSDHGPKSCADATKEDKDEESSDDGVDLDSLEGYLKANMSASSKVAGKSVIALIGESGAGKTTAILAFAGVKLERQKARGIRHFCPVDLPTHLASFETSSGSTSVTRTLNATSLTLEDNGESVTICDTPGFGDSAGAEIDISNGIAISCGLKTAKAVKPVLVLNARVLMGGDRSSSLKKTLNTTIRMLGNPETIDFSPFAYLFTRCGSEEEEDMPDMLEGLRDELVGENDPKNQTIVALLSDMVRKTSERVLCFNPSKTKAASEVLVHLWRKGNVVTDPETFFAYSISKESSTSLKNQLFASLKNLDNHLQSQDYENARICLKQLLRLAEAAPLNETKHAATEGQEKIRKFVGSIRKSTDSITKAMVEMGLETHERFKESCSDLKKELLSLSKAQVVHELCNGHEDEFHRHAFSILKKLFVAIGSCAKTIDSRNLEGNHDTLQCALLRAGHLEQLTDLGLAVEFEAEKTNLLDLVASKIAPVLTSVESNLQSPDHKNLVGQRDPLFFLVAMKCFLETTGMASSHADSNEWSNLKLVGRLDGVMGRLVDETKVCVGRITELTALFQNLEVTNETNLVESLETVGSDSVKNLRSFLLALSTLDESLLTEIQESGSKLTLMVGDFDNAIREFLVKVATFADTETKELQQQPSQDEEALARLIERDRSLCNDVVASASFCTMVKQWNSFDTPRSFDEAWKALVSVEGTLTTEIQILDAEKTQASTRARILSNRIIPLTPSDKELEEATNTKARAALTTWYDKATELQQFKKDHEHCNVKQNHPKLGKWVKNQRKQKQKMDKGQKSSMTVEKHLVLDNLGFNWGGTRIRVDWESRFIELKQFKRKKKHCNVPKSSGPLGGWAGKQRSMYRALMNGESHYNSQPITLTEERVEKLKSIGFVWELRAARKAKDGHESDE